MNIETGADTLYHHVVSKETTFDTFSLKYTAKIESKRNKHAFSGLIRIKRDSIVWISITPALGIEMARIIMTPDSLKFLNRIDQTFYEGNYSYINKIMQLEMDYFTIQSILTNQFFLYPIKGKRQRNLSKYKHVSENDKFSLQPDFSIDTALESNEFYDRIIQKMFINPQLYKIHTILLEDSTSGRNATMHFNDYIDVENNKFPQNLTILFGNTSDSLSVEIKYQKITVNTNLNFNYKVPGKYVKIQ